MTFLAFTFPRVTNWQHWGQAPVLSNKDPHPALGQFLPLPMVLFSHLTRHKDPHSDYE